MRFQLLGWALSLAYATASAQNVTNCPGDGVCYTVNVPSGGKDLFFQISGPTSMSWIGLGQGGQMSGSNMFIIYSNAAGTNVTLSARLGTGHVMPQSDTTAAVTLLDGSTVSNGKMIANVKCANCQSWSGGQMDFTSSSTNWIYGYESGSALKTDSVSASISKHDQYGPFTLNLASATGGDGTVNPFTKTVLASGSTPSLNGGGSGGYGSLAPSSNSTDADSDDSVGTTLSRSTIAHGIMGAGTFVVLFPTGSIILRILPFKNVIWIHVGIQIFSYLVALAVLETGVWVAVTTDQLMLTHPVLGLVVICGLFLQPFLGLGHHILYKRQGGPNALTLPHIWWGRILITVGIINGFLGLKLAGSTVVLSTAYAAVAGVMWAIWMGVAALSFFRGNRSSGSIKGVSKSSIRRIDSFDSREMMPYPADRR